jgi:4-hydroxy-3-methylbut-2-enyl diphosphate reductase
VDSPDEVPEDLSGTIAVTAGASAPEALIDAVVARLNPAAPPEEVVVIDEEEYFPPPREVRDLVRAVSTALTFSLGAPAPEGGGPLADDRLVTASAALDALGE